jgi:hypothetical protein
MLASCLGFRVPKERPVKLEQRSLQPVIGPLVSVFVIVSRSREYLSRQCPHVEQLLSTSELPVIHRAPPHLEWVIKAATAHPLLIH